MTYLLFAVFGHRWKPAEPRNEPGLTLVCRHCGHLRSLEEGTTVKSLRDDMPGGEGGSGAGSRGSPG
jgi:hypothetical protein